MAKDKLVGMAAHTTNRKLFVLRQFIQAAIQLVLMTFPNGSGIETRLMQAKQLLQDEIEYRCLDDAPPPTAA